MGVDISSFMVAKNTQSWFYQVAFRKKLYGSLEELQKNLDEWLDYYNNERTHQGKICCGRTPKQTLIDGKSSWANKNLAQI